MSRRYHAAVLWEGGLPGIARLGALRARGLAGGRLQQQVPFEGERAERLDNREQEEQLQLVFVHTAAAGSRHTATAGFRAHSYGWFSAHSYGWFRAHSYGWFSAHSYGCFFESGTPADDEFEAFLATMRELTARHLASYDHTWKYLPQTLVEIPLTALATEAPAGTVLVPREESFLFEVSGVEIKGDDEHGVDAQYPWEEHPQRSHSQILAVGPFYLDKFPVTAANYSVYLEATGYEPAEAYNWLKNWDGPRRNRGPACDLPQHRRGARLLRLEGRAPATLLGVAVRSLGHRRAPLSLGR